MDERHDPQTNAPDAGELLAAYLDGETDDVTSARIERRLRTDPGTAAKLDTLAHIRARLQRLDEVEPPADFRERLDARLRSERDKARPATPPMSSHTGSRPGRLAPFAAAAGLLLVAVVGGVALLNIRGGGDDESVGAAAEIHADAEEPEAADAPMLASPDDGADAAEERAARDADIEQQAETSGAALPNVATDSDITARLQQTDQEVDDPVAREAQLRARAGLPAAPICLDDFDAVAVDLVERAGQPLLAALITERGGPRVVLFDPRACARIRTFEP
jgi:negative regulator of sigma E activity